MSATLRLQQATALHQAGRLAEAQAAYRNVLATEPNNADALHLLGILAHQTGHPTEAETLIRRAIAQAPNIAAFHSSLGNILKAQARATEAEAAYRAAIRLQPNTPEFHHHLGLALRDQARTEDAATSFRAALRLSRDFVPARIDLGNLLVETGRARDAEPILRAALRTAPKNPLVLNALGLALASQEKHADALVSFDAALLASPGYAPAATNRAATLVKLERFTEAAEAYRPLIVAFPQDDDLALSFARVLLRLEQAKEAETILRPLTERQPANAEAQHEFGRALAFQQRTGESADALREAVRIDPERAAAWHDYGMALRDLADWPGALAPFAEAARLEPDDADFRTSYAYALLANGNFADAWPHFLFRTKKPGNARLREPEWDGAPTEKTVLIHAEQGLGDTLQFCRFVPEAARRARIILGCPKALNALLHCLPDVADIVSGEPVPPYDMQIPLMSLPVLFRAEPADFAKPMPYINADKGKIAAWRERIAPLPGRRIGIVWAGNPKYPADRRRSVPAALLAPLLAVPGCSFVSLQVGEAAAASPAGELFDAAPSLTDFTDTAALVATLDLVISVDTSVAHLAGAMGQQVWLLNRADTDWRWLLDRAESPWYPSMRIFRQAAPGDWDSVVQAVAAALRNGP